MRSRSGQNRQAHPVLKAINWPVELEERFLMPPRARDPQRVLSTMAFSAATQRLRLDRFDLQRFVDYEDEVIAEAGIRA